MSIRMFSARSQWWFLLQELAVETPRLAAGEGREGDGGGLEAIGAQGGEPGKGGFFAGAARYCLKKVWKQMAMYKITILFGMFEEQSKNIEVAMWGWSKCVWQFRTLNWIQSDNDGAFSRCLNLTTEYIECKVSIGWMCFDHFWPTNKGNQADSTRTASKAPKKLAEMTKDEGLAPKTSPNPMLAPLRSSHKVVDQEPLFWQASQRCPNVWAAKQHCGRRCSFSATTRLPQKMLALLDISESESAYAYFKAVSFQSFMDLSQIPIQQLRSFKTQVVHVPTASV